MFLPEKALTQHVAVLGKTGSGKSSTAKLIVEDVSETYRVCILDPVKSDWWGLTRSRDGKKPGLPFDILGGPHAHVPIDAHAGKAIAELVANGTLRHTIIDMADFPAGGQVRFFAEFAPMLLRKMKGVLYLVIEEAHLFAPKERSGMGEENMSIHWAKMLATAGRSKGIRLILATQRTQSIHNALLGSCDTMIALKLTAPADQEPVIKWLKANTQKEVVTEVAQSLGSLKTGEGWVCSGEVGLFKRLKFPLIKTFDNTSTPTDDTELLSDVALPADHQRQATLTSLLAHMGEQIASNDPVKLRARIAELERRPAAPTIDPAAIDQAGRAGFAEGRKSVERLGLYNTKLAANCLGAAIEQLNSIKTELDLEAANYKAEDVPWASFGGPTKHVFNAEASAAKTNIIESAVKKVYADSIQVRVDKELSPSARAILDAIHNAYPVSLSFASAARRAGISKRSSAYRKYAREVETSGEVQAFGAGLRGLPQFANSAPIGNSIDRWISRLPPTYGNMLRAVVEHGPIDKNEIAERAGVSKTSSGLSAGIKELRSLELITEQNGRYQLSEGLA